MCGSNFYGSDVTVEIALLVYVVGWKLKLKKTDENQDLIKSTEPDKYISTGSSNKRTYNWFNFKPKYLKIKWVADKNQIVWNEIWSL